MFGRKFALLVAMVVATVSIGVASIAPASAAGADTAPRASHPRVDRVLIIALPGVGWRDLAGHGLPNLHRVLDGAGVADLSTRAPFLVTDLAGNYASLSAGDKAVGARDVVDGSGIAPAGAAYDGEELVGPATARTLFNRRTGATGAAGLVVLSVDQIRAANAGTPFRAAVGAFGDALAGAGWSRAVIANGDGLDGPEAAAHPRRAAAIAMMNAKGSIPAGELSQRLLQADPTAPFGVRLDPDAVEMNFATDWNPKSAVLVEASDLVRVEEIRRSTTRAQAKAMRARALRDTDTMVGQLLTHVDLDRDAVVVVGTAPNRADGRLAAVAVHAPGVKAGLLRSGTTQRTGFVQIMDVAPSVLDLVGVAVPNTMRGRPVAVAQASPDVSARERFLVDADRAAEFRDGILAPVASVLIVLLSALVIAIGVARFRREPIWSMVGSWSALLTLAFIPAAYLARAIPFHTLGAGWYWAWIGLVSATLAVAARAAGRHHRLDPMMMLLATTVGVLGVDVVIGSPLQFNGALGFSPEIAGRFIGFGNAGYAAFGAAALFFACLAPVRWPRSGRRIAIAVLVGAILLDGSPIWGADVGGVLSLVPAFGFVIVRLMGWRLRWRAIAWAAAGTAIAIAGAVAVDLSRPPGSRTHLGRLVEQLQGEGPGELLTTISRKIGMNLASWSSSPFRWLVPIVMVGFVLLWLRPDRPGAVVWRAIDPNRALTIGFAVLLLLGYGLNDTGVLVPALMGAIGLAVIVPLALGEVGAQDTVDAWDYRRRFRGRTPHAVRERTDHPRR